MARQPRQSALTASNRILAQRRAAPMPRVSDEVSDSVWRVPKATRRVTVARRAAGSTLGGDRDEGLAHGRRGFRRRGHGHEGQGDGREKYGAPHLKILLGHHDVDALVAVHQFGDLDVAATLISM